MSINENNAKVNRVNEEEGDEHCQEVGEIMQMQRIGDKHEEGKRDKVTVDIMREHPTEGKRSVILYEFQ